MKCKLKKAETPITTDILGTKYSIYFYNSNQDSALKSCDGYCDFTSKKIVVKRSKELEDELDDFAAYRRKILRHEIVHAYLGESGLRSNFMHPEYGHDETMVDWIAIQFPKMYKTFEELGIMD